MIEKNLPLSGIKVMVTRAAASAQKIYERLKKLGAEVLPYPTIEVEEYLDPAGWNSFDKIKSDNKWLIFTSENGVQFFMKQFLEQHGDLKTLSDYKIAVIGKSTASDLQEFELKADFVPKESTVISMGLEMKNSIELGDSEIVRVRGVLAADSIEKTLTDDGTNVIPLTVYTTHFPKWPDKLKKELFENLPDVIIFSSGSTVAGLIENLNNKEVKTLISKTKVYSIGPSTSKVLKKADINVTVEADPHNMTALINQLVKNVSQNIDGRSH